MRFSKGSTWRPGSRLTEIYGDYIDWRVKHPSDEPGPARGTPGSAKVSDFGLAKAFDQAGLSGLTRTGAAAGKPTFMPRQQVVNFKHARPEVDVWAAAACLYWMLTGRPPREFPPGRDPWHVVLQDDPVPLRRRNRAVPSGLAEVVDHALRDQPAIGFSTADALRQALDRNLCGHATAVSALVSRPGRRGSGRTRRRVLLGSRSACGP